MPQKYLKIPIIDESVLDNFQVGDEVLITGSLYTARDQAHMRFIQTIKNSGELPIDLNGQAIYYTGPSPARPGQTISSCGPTTSSRMDNLTIPLLERGLKVMIGKGNRADFIREACKRYKALYIATIGGASAYLAKCVKKVEEVAYHDLGIEAVKRLYVENFPGVIAFDINGNTIYTPKKIKD